MIRKTFAIVLSFALTNVGVIGLGSTRTENDPQIVGQLIVSGTATVNDKKAITGTSVFSNSRIGVACAKGSTAIVNLGRLGRVELSPGAKLVLRFSDGIINGDLLEGKAVVSTPNGVKVAINTPDGVISSDGKAAAVTPVTTQRGVRCVPVAMSTSSTSTVGLSPGVLAALLIGAGGSAVAAAAVSTSENTSSVSSIIP
jgi:fructose-specific component phosphotransferase system IIB-like protein